MSKQLKQLQNTTSQEIFDKVLNHLREQKVRAWNEEEKACKYRVEVEDGKVLKCAAGCLIDDDEYDWRFDYPSGYQGSSWDSLVKQGDIAASDYDDLIKDLQWVHDNVLPTTLDEGIKLWEVS